MKPSGLQQKLIVTALIIVFVLVVPSVMALPQHQEIPCFDSEGCPETVNPEPEEYYSVQCTINAVWIWVSMPNPSLVTFVPAFQIDSLSDGDSLVTPNNVTVTRSGDIITLSGENGNLAPQPGEKSFSWNECIDLNGGLPELPPIPPELTDEQAECMSLPTEQEKVDCLDALESESGVYNTETCESFLYANSHIEECFDDPCHSTIYASQHLEECTLETSYEVLFAILSQCFNPINPPVAAAAVVAFGAFRRRRRHK